MHITVVVCTYNRAPLLKLALDTIALSSVPAGIAWEVLVVDNNSSDCTRKVVEEFIRRFPGRFGYLFEANRGKSNALNSAIRKSRGEILAFTDDDVTVEARWLYELSEPLLTSTCAGSGGPVKLEWTCRPPAWLPLDEPRLLAALAGFEPAFLGTDLSEPPIGANMAIRRTMFTKYGGFRTDLGPGNQAGKPPVNEDTEFGRRLLKGGEHFAYCPRAIVHHLVTESRLQKPYFLQWWFEKGRADAIELGTPVEAKRFFQGIPVISLRRMAIWGLRRIFSFRRPRRFKSRLWVRWLAGGILEHWRAARGAHEDIRSDVAPV